MASFGPSIVHVIAIPINSPRSFRFQPTANLGTYLKNLDLVKPKRWYLSPPNSKNMVVFSEFATQSIATIKLKAEPTQLDFNYQIDRKSQEKYSQILLDYTKVSQVVANGKSDQMRVRVDDQLFLSCQ